MRTLAIIILTVLALWLPQAHAQQPATGAKQTISDLDIPEWQARLELADLLAGSQRFEEAEQQYRKVLAAQPDNEHARQGLARILGWTGRSAEATALFARLPDTSLTPDDRMLLADHYIGKKEYDAAARQLETILATQPDNDRARLKLAQVLSWDEKLDASLKQYERLLTRHPDDIQLRRKYAQVLTWAGRNEDAIRELKRTLD